MLQRDVGVPVLIVMQHGMALAERAPPRVLAAQPNAKAIRSNRRQSQGLGRGPIERLLASGHGSPRLEEFRNFRMRVKTVWKLSLFLEQCSQPLLFCARGLFFDLGFGTAMKSFPDAFELFRGKLVRLALGFG